MRPDHPDQADHTDHSGYGDDTPPPSRRDRYAPNILTGVLFGLLALVMAIQVAC